MVIKSKGIWDVACRGNFVCTHTQWEIVQVNTYVPRRKFKGIPIQNVWAKKFSVFRLFQKHYQSKHHRHTNRVWTQQWCVFKPSFHTFSFWNKTFFVYMVHDCIWHGQLLLSLKLLTTFVLNTHFFYCSDNVLTLENTITKCNIHVDRCVSTIEFASWKDFFYCFNVMFG